MRVFSLELPDKPLTNFELSAYARELGIPHFRGVLMRDTLSKQTPECGFVNLNTMGVDIHKVIGKIPTKRKKAFVLSKYRNTGPYNPLHLQLDSKDSPLPGQDLYNAVDAIAMRHDICYRDNENGKTAGTRYHWIET